MGDCKIDISSKCDHFDENLHISVLGVTDDIQLRVIDGHMENTTHEVNILTVRFLQLLRLEQLYKEEAEKEDKPVDTIDGKKVISNDKTKSFQDKNLF